uniref:DUF4220 domain-containing protein n=1 Tax=Cajanus cajan TaxID=3821 RepID=A0A151QYR2_CAJCA|nr:hypothetical protein KK1_043466 [Cajanus cajan]
MVNPIPKFAKNVWSKWNIRGVVLVSLSLQIILIVLAPFRKRSRKNILVLLLWSTYLLADFTASFCVGLISNKYGDEDTPISSVNDFLLAFWTPFLLLHLGGPDPITAFALEDNELWLRHMLGLIVQVCLTGYVFLLTLPENTLWLPTSLVFMAGVIKFAERTRSLQRASVSNFRQSMVRQPDPGPNYAKLMEEFNLTNVDDDLSDVQVVIEAYRYFNIFKGLVVDMIFSFHERSESRNFFINLTAVDALRIIEVELNFIYQAFYTKAEVICSMVGFFFRVTYTLLYGAVALDGVSLLMLIFSDHSFALLNSLTSQKDDSESDAGTGTLKNSSVVRAWFKRRRYSKLCRRLLFRRWSESISGFNLVRYCQHKRKNWVDDVIKYIGAKEVVDQWKYEEKQPLLQKLWIFIFEELERKSGDAEDVETIQRMCSSRGEWVIQEGELERDDLNKLMPYVERNNVTFDQCLILWHIATDLLQKKNGSHPDQEKGSGDGIEIDGKGKKNGNDPDRKKGSDQYNDDELQDFSKLLSDYMLYLLIMQPTMMSAVRGIGQIRFQDTCAEATNFFSKREGIENIIAKQRTIRRTLDAIIALGNKMRNKLVDFIKKDVNVEHDPSDVKGDRSKSLLFDACKLAYVINNLKGSRNKWKVIAQVWVELLSYAAANCIPITHVQQLSKGGEFLSLVWLLMTHLGLAKQFQIKEGHARAKLIVGEFEENQNQGS